MYLNLQVPTTAACFMYMLSEALCFTGEALLFFSKKAIVTSTLKRPNLDANDFAGYRPSLQSAIHFQASGKGRLQVHLIQRFNSFNSFDCITDIASPYTCVRNNK